MSGGFPSKRKYGANERGPEFIPFTPRYMVGTAFSARFSHAFFIAYQNHLNIRMKVFPTPNCIVLLRRGGPRERLWAREHCQQSLSFLFRWWIIEISFAKFIGIIPINVGKVDWPSELNHASERIFNGDPLLCEFSVNI